MRHGYIELKRKSTSRKIKERIFLFLLMVGLIQLSFQEIRIIEDYKNLSTFNKLKYLTKQQHHQKYENIDVVEQELKELPICVIVRKDGLELEESINLQNYTNYKIVRVEQSLLFNSLRQIITSNCSNTDIVLLV